MITCCVARTVDDRLFSALAIAPTTGRLGKSDDFGEERAAHAEFWTSDYNAFYRQCTSVTSDVTSLANGAAAPLTYRSLHEQTAANAQDRHSLVSDDVPTDPFTSVVAHGIQRPGRPAGRWEQERPGRPTSRPRSACRRREPSTSEHP